MPLVGNRVRLAFVAITAIASGCATTQVPHLVGRPPTEPVTQLDRKPVPPSEVTAVRGQDPFSGRQLPTSRGLPQTQRYAQPPQQRYPTSSRYVRPPAGQTPAIVPQTQPQYSPSREPLARGQTAQAGEARVAPQTDGGVNVSDEPPLFPNLGGDANPIFQEPDRWIDPDVVVQETETGRLMFGVGVNSNAGVVGNIVIDEQNFDWRRWPRSGGDILNGTAFRGAGQHFRLEAVPGSQVSRYVASFQEPYLMNSAVSLGLSGFFFDRIYQYWSEQRYGGRMSLGYRFPDTDLTVTSAVRYEDINIRNPFVPTPPELARVVGDNQLIGFRIGMTHDTRDNPFMATEGHYFEMSFEEVVGTFTYPKVETDLRKYFLVRERPDGSGRHTINGRVYMGIAGSNTPIYDNFYAGGFSTIRGFNFRGASPRNLGVTVGGPFMFLASVEYMFPLTADDMLRMVFFCDTGTVEQSVKFVSQNYRVAPGVGLRITVPAMGPAPIALDFAFPVAEAAGDDKQTFSFFIGFGR